MEGKDIASKDSVEEKVDGVNERHRSKCGDPRKPRPKYKDSQEQEHRGREQNKKLSAHILQH